MSVSVAVSHSNTTCPFPGMALKETNDTAASIICNGEENIKTIVMIMKRTGCVILSFLILELSI